MNQSELVLIAKTCFADSGYNGVSISDLAKKCGLQKASLYHHFHSKNELAQSIIEQIIEQLKSFSYVVKKPEELKSMKESLVLIHRFKLDKIIIEEDYDAIVGLLECILHSLQIQPFISASYTAEMLIATSPDEKTFNKLIAKLKKKELH